MEETIQTKSIEETQSFAKIFAKKLHGGDVVLLYGNLGAGKTTFVQGLANGLGIEKRIISPTFIIMRTYEIQGKSNRSADGANAKTFYHVDLYRLKQESEIENIGLVDLMGKDDGIVVIEWPERLGGLLPKNAWEIYFETVGENERKVIVQQN